MRKSDIFKYIIAIRTAKNGNIYAGTGFFIKALNEKIYLVTANHVARDTTPQTDIWSRDPSTGFPRFVKIQALNPMAMWLYHPVADLAILEVDASAYGLVEDRYIPIDKFENCFDVVPDRESKLTMFGMPDVYTELQFAPFTCDCNPASDSWVAYFDGTGSMFKCFMLDKPSTQGFSGGPVIAIGEDDIKCYGIIHGTRQDNTGGKLAIVVQSAYLTELLSVMK